MEPSHYLNQYLLAITGHHLAHLVTGRDELFPTWCFPQASGHHDHSKATTSDCWKNQIESGLDAVKFHSALLILLRFPLFCICILSGGRLNSLRATFFRGNKNLYLHLMSFLHIDMTQVVEILPDSQYHGCWCPGDARSQGINNHDIYYVEPNQFSPCTLRFRVFVDINLCNSSQTSQLHVYWNRFDANILDYELQTKMSTIAPGALRPILLTPVFYFLQSSQQPLPYRPYCQEYQHRFPTKKPNKN